MGNIVKPFKQEPSSFAYRPLTVPLISVEAQNENLGVFSFAEWMKATKKIRQDMVKIRENSSIRAVYKGYMDDTTFAPSRTKTSTPVSVIECLHDSSQARQEWMEEVTSLGKIRHPNLVKLLEEETLPWEIRVKIAIGTAQGLAFLHSTNNSPLHLQLRPHNIMLDEQYNAKLFHLESNNPWLKDETTFMGRPEYIPHEWLMSARLGIESDVYIFGVILLELLTGRKDRSNFLKNQSVTGSFLPDDYKIGEIIDPRLGNDYPVNAATLMGTPSQRCTKRDKKKRPLMQQVLDVLNDIAEIKY